MPYFSHCIRILSVTLGTGCCALQPVLQLYQLAALGGFSPKSQKVTLPLAMLTEVCVLHWLPQSPSRTKLQVPQKRSYSISLYCLSSHPCLVSPPPYQHFLESLYQTNCLHSVKLEQHKQDGEWQVMTLEK